MFKVYKVLNQLEKKKHTKPHFCKRLFKLIFVLFSLKNNMPIDEIWRQVQNQADEERLNDSQHAGSSVFGGVLSDNNFGGDKGLALKNENDSESNYSNFKTLNANIFSLNSSNQNIGRHTSHSPTVDARNARNANTVLDLQVEQERSPTVQLIDVASSQKALNLKPELDRTHESLVYGDYSQINSTKNVATIKTNENSLRTASTCKPKRQRPTSHYQTGGANRSGRLSNRDGLGLLFNRAGTMIDSGNSLQQIAGNRRKKTLREH